MQQKSFKMGDVVVSHEQFIENSSDILSNPRVILRLFRSLFSAEVLIKLSKIYELLIGVVLGDGWFLKLWLVLLFEEVVGLKNVRLMAAIAVVKEMVTMFVFSIVLLKHLYAFLEVGIFSGEEKGCIVFVYSKVIQFKLHFLFYLIQLYCWYNIKEIRLPLSKQSATRIYSQEMVASLLRSVPLEKKKPLYFYFGPCKLSFSVYKAIVQLFCVIYRKYSKRKGSRGVAGLLMMQGRVVRVELCAFSVLCSLIIILSSKHNNYSEFIFKFMGKLQISLLILTLLSLSATSEIKQAVSLAVTVYNDQFAIVKDVRSISFDAGRSDLYFTDVSSNIQTETVTFKALQNTESIKVYEQNYQANLINTKAILQKYIDKDIQIQAKVGENSTRVTGTLLGFNSGYILKTNSGIEVYNNIDAIQFPALPAGFLTLPTLNWKVFSDKAIVADCEVAYRTTGFSWKSDYSLVLNGDQTKADVGGWVTIDNNSGKRYQNAKLKLIAGDVNTVSNRYGGGYYQLQTASTMARTAAPSFSEKSFSDYHMYTLSQTVTLEENSQKQVEFVSKVYGIAVRKYNLITISTGGYSQQNIKAANRIELQNTQANKLGIPLPKGTVRVFKEDKDDGSLQFIGEDSISHTPKDENITVTTGNAFDITANKLASNYQSFANSGYSADLNLTISNHKDIEAEIVIEINNYHGDNNQFGWKTSGIKVQKISASLYRIIRKFKANEKWSLLWSENYRP